MMKFHVASNHVLISDMAAFKARKTSPSVENNSLSLQYVVFNQDFTLIFT